MAGPRRTPWPHGRVWPDRVAPAQRRPVDWWRANPLSSFKQLVALKGVGLWTAEAYLMMCEGRLDVFPGGDVALQEAIRWADGAEVRPDQKGAYARAEIWRPYRAVAACEPAHTAIIS